jgi:hypothetical protein
MNSIPAFALDARVGNVHGKTGVRASSWGVNEGRDGWHVCAERGVRAAGLIHSFCGSFFEISFAARGGIYGIK